MNACGHRGWGGRAVGGALAASCLLLCAPAAATERFGLFAGNNRGGEDEAGLRWAEQDAGRMRDLFVGLGGVRAADAILLLGGGARDLRAALASLAVRVAAQKTKGERVELFLYFSGHGDDAGLHLNGARLAFVAIDDLVSQIGADTVITIVDACRGAGHGAKRNKGATPGPEFDVRLTRNPGPTGHVLITSAGPDEVAQESDALGGSFFTHHLLSGLRGAADADQDAQVSLAEAYRYSYHHTLFGSHRTAAAVQHPEMELTLGGEGEVILTSLGGAATSLLLPGAVYGDVLVVDDRSGRVLAEVDKDQGSVARLALPPGRLRVQVRQHGRIYAAELSSDWGGEVELDASTLIEQPRLAALGKGAALDPAPWAMTGAFALRSAAALGRALSTGVAMSLARPLHGARWFGRAVLQAAQATATNDSLAYRHFEGRVGLGAGYGADLGLLQLEAAATLSALGVWEQRRRREAERLAQTGLVRPLAGGYTVGPELGVEAGLGLPLVADWGVVVVAGPSAALLKVDGDVALVTGVSGRVGALYHF
ncbi:MAG: caspase family protein [Deltaproteobacteria bacterium]|nr:caspase family protein [Deltaproteobacteria bacterium]